ncbi:MAG TPA: hypothetical protein VH590_19135 [Ktedonobacterales bacterium]|jgi:hypothetical protein
MRKSARARLLLGLAATLMGICCLPGLAGCAPAGSVIIDWVDFIKFDGITYLARFDHTGRPLQESDLGPIFAKVQFRLDGNVHDLHYQSRDGDAAFLDAGTPVYTVNGYKPQFRLAAHQDGSIVLYEADTNPKARHGADLLDIGGKVQYIGINSGQDGITELGAVKDPQQVAALVAMVLKAPVDQNPQNQAGPTYFIAFHLNDATTITRAYETQSRELSRGIMVPEEFEVAVEQALQKK